MTRRHAQILQALAALETRIQAVKMQTAATVINARAVLEAVQRSRARRNGIPFEPDPVENFVIDRSNRIH